MDCGIRWCDYNKTNWKHNQSQGERPYVRDKNSNMVSEIPICTGLFSSQWELEDVPVTQKPTCEELEQSVEEFERQAGGKK